MKTEFLGLVDYTETWNAMRELTQQRSNNDPDELWVCEHPSVYTQGQAGKPEHVINPNGIPIVNSDRGGQVTYHGPGQVIVYTLINIRRAGLGVRDMVTLLENSVIELLAGFHITAVSRRDAPGVYVGEAKIAALGLRVRRGCTYHGVSLNIDADLTPFNGINPCGYENMAITSTQLLGVECSKRDIVDQFVNIIQKKLLNEGR